MRQAQIGSADLQLRPICPAKVIDLRHLVLREGLPREMAIFAGDDEATTRHFGAFVGSQLACCLTLLRSQWEAQPAWQLRGMATHPQYQRSGIGRQLVLYAEQAARAADPAIRLMWCNARLAAAGFYQKLGWQIVSAEPFEIPGAGPHVKMLRRLDAQA